MTTSLSIEGAATPTTAAAAAALLTTATKPFEEEGSEEEREIEQLLERALSEDIRPRFNFTSVLLALSRQAEEVSEICTSTAELADKISHKVRLLDQEQSRIKLAIGQVESARRLISCLNGAEICMSSSRWIDAIAYVQTYLEYDPGTIGDLFADSMIPLDDGAISIQTARDRMESYRTRLLEHCMEQMTKAGAEPNKDDATWTKYWLLFPKLGESLAGMERLAGDMCRALRQSCAAPMNIGDGGGAISFVDFLTMMYETIASIVDRQRSIVHEAYGPGRLLYLMRALEREADLQSIKVLDMLSERRSLARILRIIQQRQNVINGIRAEEDPGSRVDIKEVSQVLEEISLISQRACVFQRFMRIRAEAELAQLRQAEMDTTTTTTGGKPRDQLASALLNDEHFKYSPDTGLLKISDLALRVRELLSIYYISFEECFLTQSIRKAIKIDSYDAQNDEWTSSCVEDCFFIFNRAIMRSIATYDVDIICVVLNMLSRTIEVEYMRDGLQRRLLKGFGGERATMLSERSDARVGFIILLNNLQVSMAHLKSLTDAIGEEIDRALPMMNTRSSSSSSSNSTGSNNDPALDAKTKEKISSCLSPIIGSQQAFESVLRTGCVTLFNQVVRHRLKQLLSDGFGGMKTHLTEEEFNNDVDFVQVFNAQFTMHVLHDNFRQYLEPNVLFIMLGFCLDSILANYERLILSAVRISTFGAFKIDKDLRGFLELFNTYTEEGGQSFRDRFTRLFQMISLATVDDIRELTTTGDGNGSISLLTELKRLSKEEIKRVLTARFGQELVTSSGVLLYGSNVAPRQ